MVFPVARHWKITTGFDEMRPLSVPEEQRDHPHGAWDIAAPTGTPIVAPEPGRLYYFVAIRASLDRKLGELDFNSHSPFEFRGHHYFYDTYGVLIILIARNERTHIFAHSWLNQVYNRPPTGDPLRWTYVESPKVERWPVMCWHTFEDRNRVIEGEKIGAIGSAGYSTGPHAHYEIHPTSVWTEHENRIRPETLYPSEWEKGEA
jgi:hypothetical protein